MLPFDTLKSLLLLSGRAKGAPTSTTTVDKIVEILRQESRAVIQEAVAELDTGALKTFVTLLVKEAEVQVADAEKKAADEKKAASATAGDNQCRP